MRRRTVSGLVLVVVGGCSLPERGDPPAGVGEQAVAGRDGDGCRCALTEVCDVEGRCVPRPVTQPGEAFGEIELFRRQALWDPTVLGDLGRASATFHDHEPLPPDRRPRYTTTEGEPCFYEVGPALYPSTPASPWPTGPGLGAGDLVIDVAGSTSPMELVSLYDDFFGWTYRRGQAPPPLSQGSAVFPSLFAPVHLPSGAAFQVRGAGGPDVPTLAVSGELPASFVIAEPAAEAPGATAEWMRGFRVRWSPPQPSAYMNVFVAHEIAGEYAVLRCTVKDDGEAVLPAEGFRTFFGEVVLQLQRTTERYVRTETADGKPLHLSVRGSHLRAGKVRLVASTP